MGFATACAIFAIAVAAQSLAHEWIGHGTGCLIAGGRPLFVDSIFFACSTSSWLGDAGGVAANLLFGCAALAAFKAHPRFTPTGLLLWSFAAVNLLFATGYMIQSGLTGRGDWAAIIPPFPLRSLVLIATGVFFYRASLQFLAQSMIAAVRRGALNRAQAAPLLFTCYIECALLILAAGWFHRGPNLFWRNAGAEAFLGLLGFLLLPWIIRRNTKQIPAGPLQGSPAWLAAGAVATLLFIFVFGPGIRF